MEESSRPSARILRNDPIVHMRGALTLHIFCVQRVWDWTTSENESAKREKDNLVMRQCAKSLGPTWERVDDESAPVLL